MATSEAPTLEFLEENAEIIVTGICTSVNVQMMYTNYSFRTYEIIKGSIEGHFSIVTGEGTNAHISATPVRFEQGQEVILFLNNRDSGYNVFWGSWGKRLLTAEKEENLEYLRNMSLHIDLDGKLVDAYDLNTTGPVNGSISISFAGGIEKPATIIIDPFRRDLPLFLLISGFIYMVVFRKE